MQNGGERAATVTLQFYDFDGRELTAAERHGPACGARAFRPRPAAGDAASVAIRGNGSPLVAALLQSASD